MSYLVLIGGWHDVLSVHGPTEDKSNDTKDSLCEELEQVFEHFLKYRFKFC